jgi:hypothetical protein
MIQHMFSHSQLLSLYEMNTNIFRGLNERTCTSCIVSVAEVRQAYLGENRTVFVDILQTFESREANHHHLIGLNINTESG